MTAVDRDRRANAADALCSAAFAHADGTGETPGIALVAVGGYGRRELAPYSDLDVVLVHADDVDASELATKVWYPLWDAGLPIDHSVRALADVATAAQRDIRVALGLLDARHVAGDPTVTLRLRADVLTRWRRGARSRLPELRRLAARPEPAEELAHASVPDLKLSLGGIRDTTVLRSLSATWVVDVPHVDLERSVRDLLDVRDALHEAAGRATDRVAPELWPDLARRLGLADVVEAQRHVRRIGRRVTHLSRLTWRRVDGALATPSRHRRPEIRAVGHGVALAGGEVVLDRRADPSGDPLLLLRAAAEAAERRLPLSPPTATRLADQSPDIPTPWPAEGRQLFTRMLAAGPGLLPVWETLEETGALDRLLPEWERVRLLPHASSVHRFTVDRHMVETCIEAAALMPTVRRPDILLTAALLHDIGKAAPGRHSTVGEPMARSVAERLGFPPGEASLVGSLVRRHLLLSAVATTRDLRDPTTIDMVATRVDDVETLDLLHVLTQADARATAPSAWTPWRATLVGDLVTRVRGRLLERSDTTPAGPAAGPRDDSTVALPAGLLRDRSRICVEVEPDGTGAQVLVFASEQIGLLAAVAGALVLSGVSVRSARAWAQDDFAVSSWHVADAEAMAPALLRERISAVLDGRMGLGQRAILSSGEPSPWVAVHPEESRDATLIEVRTRQHPAVVHLVCRALADLGMSVRSAHVETFGPQAVNMFYVQEAGAAVLADHRAAEAAHAVRERLGSTVTLVR